MAKSSRRRKQDRAKAQAKRAEESRLRARTERARRTSERITRLIDPKTPPAAVAEILAAEFPDSLVAGDMIQMRRNSGVPAKELAETARLMLAGREGGVTPDSAEIQSETRTGTLAVAAWAAHLAGDEAAEQAHVRELLARADAEMAADGDPVMLLETIRSIVRRGHLGEACELIEPYLREHPSDDLAAGIYAEALTRAHGENEPGERERAALARFEDKTSLDELREAFEAFLTRSGGARSSGAGADSGAGDSGRDWKEHVLRQTDKLRADYEREHWSAADRDAFDALAYDLVIAFPYDSEDDHETAEGPGTPITSLAAFAADPETPVALAARATAWNERVLYGLWQVADPVPSPGVWCTDLVSSVRMYVHFPAEVMAAAAPWAVWMGPLVPVDGIWRCTGSGFWLSPVEGDALAECVEDLATVAALKEAGAPDHRIPDPRPARFGQAEPYGVRAGDGDPMAPDSADVVGMLIAIAVLQLASWVWLKRANRMEPTNTEGHPLVAIDATVAVRGDLAQRLMSLPDFGEEEDGKDGQLVWWGEPVDNLTFLPDDDRERLVLGRVTPGKGKLRVLVNSQQRLARLLKILASLGAEPEVTEDRRFQPSVDFAWGPVPDPVGRPALEWEKAWTEQQISVLPSGTPRHAMTVGDEAEIDQVESMLRQLEYQSALAVRDGRPPLDITWLRTELGLSEAIGLSEAKGGAPGSPSAETC